jgi:hypothetical protein
MAETATKKTIYKLTQEQFDKLKSAGEITVSGVTYAYEPNNAMISYVVSSAPSGGSSGGGSGVSFSYSNGTLTITTG